MKDRTGSKSVQKNGRFTASFVADRFTANGQSRFSAKEKNATRSTINSNEKMIRGETMKNKTKAYLKLLKVLAALFSYTVIYGAAILTLTYGWGLQPKSWLWILLIFPASWLIGSLISYAADYKEEEEEEK